MTRSLLEQIAVLPSSRRDAALLALSDQEAREALDGAWWFVSRPEQQEPPGGWAVWLIRCGRGWGKTRTGAEWLVEQIISLPTVDGVPTEWAAVGQIFAETRDVMLEGPSGIKHVLERRGLVEDRDYDINRSAWQITFGAGQKLYLWSAKDPDVGRGFNLAGAWLDEFAKWRYADRIWVESLSFALRIGPHPRAVVTTTPKATCIQLRTWSERVDGSVHLTTGSIYENRRNLSPAALAELAARYEGTVIGRQELYGDLVVDTEGSLWNANLLELHRLRRFDRADPWTSLEAEDWGNGPIPATLKLMRDPRAWRTLVAVDPPGETAECGITVGTAPLAGAATRDHAVILADMSLAGTPEVWGAQVVSAVRTFGAEKAIVESNQGGDMVRAVIHNVDPNVVVEKLPARGSKYARAEPVSALYAKGWVHHAGYFRQLEEQITTWVPSDSRSPDRLDSLVHLVNGLLKPMAPRPASFDNIAARSLGQ